MGRGSLPSATHSKNSAYSGILEAVEINIILPFSSVRLIVQLLGSS